MMPLEGRGFESLRLRQKRNTLCLLTKGVSFQLNPPCRVGEIISDDEIPCGDEIRLDGGWVDLISSAKQISSVHRTDFIANFVISLKAMAYHHRRCIPHSLMRYLYSLTLPFSKAQNPFTFVNGFLSNKQKVSDNKNIIVSPASFFGCIRYIP